MSPMSLRARTLAGPSSFLCEGLKNLLNDCVESVVLYAGFAVRCETVLSGTSEPFFARENHDVDEPPTPTNSRTWRRLEPGGAYASHDDFCPLMLCYVSYCAKKERKMRTIQTEMMSRKDTCARALHIHVSRQKYARSSCVVLSCGHRWISLRSSHLFTSDLDG